MGTTPKWEEIEMPLPNGNLLVFGEEINPADIDNHPFLAPRGRVRFAKNQVETILGELTTEEINLLRNELAEALNPSSEKGLGKALLLYAVLH